MSTTEDRYAEAGILPASPHHPGVFAEVEIHEGSTAFTNHDEDGMPVLHDVEDGEHADDDTSDTDQEA